MQDVQNIPNPDVEPNDTNDDFGSHSAIEQELDNDDIEQVDDEEGILKERDADTGIEQIRDENDDEIDTLL